MKIVKSVYWDSDISVGDEFGRGDNGGVESDDDSEVVNGYNKGIEREVVDEVVSGYGTSVAKVAKGGKMESVCGLAKV